jgi:hypothetical protein
MSQTQKKNETLLCTFRDCKNPQAENEYCTDHQPKQDVNYLFESPEQTIKRIKNEIN